jgi:hypothetical protein
MKQVVCIVDNHIYLQYGKVYNVVSEMDTDYNLERTDDGLMDNNIYRWNKSLFVSLEEFRNKKIENILS